MIVELVRVAEENGEDGIYSVNQTPWCSNDYYDVYFATCPFGRRSFFQKLNGGNRLFDPVYHCFYADPDVALRAHAIGITVTKVPSAISIHRNVPDADGHVSNAMNYYQQDRHTFVTRWAHLGPPPIDPSQR
jgi:GT2 family glycosyltransferase